MRSMIRNACLFACAGALVMPAFGDGRVRPSVRRLNPVIAPPSVGPGDVSAALAVVTSTPPSGAIDARQTSEMNGSRVAGWQSVTITFNGDVSHLDVNDFVVTQQGGQGVPPTVGGVTYLGGDTVRVDLSGAINPGAWTSISTGSAQVRLGFLPGDVNGDGYTSNLDTLLLIDAINGVVDLPNRAVDIDRNGVVSGNDLSRHTALLNGAGGIFDRWMGKTLPGFNKGSGFGNVGGFGGDGPLAGGGGDVEVVLTPDYGGNDCGDAGATVPVAVGIRRTNPGNQIFIRGLQLDTLLADSNLTLELPMTHSVPTGNIFFWNFAAQALCGIAPTLCGNQHFIVDDFDANPLLSITFTGQAQDMTSQLIIPGDGSMLNLGTIDVTLPGMDGQWPLNVVNGDESNENLGFYLVFGFGGGGDPVTTWRVNTGQAIGGVENICAGGGPLTCADMPDPDGFCSDGNACNGAETCNLANGTCEAGTPLMCDDGLFCNGAETCDPASGCVDGTAPCAAGEICLEDTDACVECVVDADCGANEVCDNGTCVIDGCTMNSDCDDMVACTTDTCNIATGMCSNTPDNSACDDGMFCTGTETCTGNGCQSSGNPCNTQTQTCNEATDTCDPIVVGCMDNDDCDDDLACNGVETCNTATGDCVDGTPVMCDGGEVCQEPNGECVTPEDKITLTPDQTCYGFGEVVTIAVNFTSDELIVGAQFFLSYDPVALDFVSAAPGAPWTVELFEEVVEAAGWIDYAVAVPFNPPGVGANAGTLATLTFVANQDICGETVVACRDNNPPTRLTTNGGLNIEPECNAAVINIIPPIAVCPDDIEVNADAGGCTANVCWQLGMDGCTGGTPDVCTATDAQGNVIPLDGTCGTFPAGINTVVCGEGAGGCTGGGSCEWTITVSDENTVESIVQLSPIVANAPFDRCITWEIFPEDCGDPIVLEEVVTIGGPGNIPGHGRIETKIPCGAYGCATARDRLHTLRGVLDPADIIEDQVQIGMYNYTRLIYFLEYKGDPAVGGNWLTSGNLNDDCVIDILDFGVFLSEFGADYGTGDTDCDTDAPHADINGDGLVNDIDYGFIQGNFLEINKQNCCDAVGEGCNPPGGGGQFAADLIIDSKGRVLSTPVPTKLLRADLNGDGVLDLGDLDLFEAGQRPAPKGHVRDRVDGARR